MKDRIKRLQAIAAGFDGQFVFDCANDRLVFVATGNELLDDECYCISTEIERHVAEPMAELLNAMPSLLDHLEGLISSDEALHEWHTQHGKIMEIVAERDALRAELRDLKLAGKRLPASNV